MKNSFKYFALLFSMTVAISSCQSDPPTVDPSVTSSSTLDIPASTYVPYAPGTPSFTLTASATTVFAGGTITLSLTSVDSNGAPYSSGVKSIMFTSSGGTSTGTIGAVSPKGGGIFQATFTGELSGTPTTVQAIVNGNAITSTVSISVTTGQVANLIIVAGDDPINGIHQAAQKTNLVTNSFAKNPVVKVVDQYGNIVTGASVTFSTAANPGSSTLLDPTSGNQATSIVLTSDANGLTSTQWSTGTSTGETDLIVTTPIIVGGVAQTATQILKATVYDKPSKPIVTVTGINKEVDLSWTVADIAGTYIYYTLYRSVGNDCTVPVSSFAPVSSNVISSTYIDSTTSAFCYYVTAFNGYLTSDASLVVTNNVTKSTSYTFNATTANPSPSPTATPYSFNNTQINCGTSSCSLTPTYQNDNCSNHAIDGTACAASGATCIAATTSICGSNSGFQLGTSSGTALAGRAMNIGSTSCDATQTDCNPDDYLNLLWITAANRNYTGYWKLDGNANASLGFPTIASAAGTLTSTGTSYVAGGKIFQALKFNGTAGDKLTLPSALSSTSPTAINPLLTLNTGGALALLFPANPTATTTDPTLDNTNAVWLQDNHSISFWFEPTSLSTQGILQSKSDFTNGTDSYYLKMDASGNLSWFVNGIIQTYTTSLKSGNWYHIAIIRGAQLVAVLDPYGVITGYNKVYTSNLYINGVLQKIQSGLFTTNPNTLANVVFGNYRVAGSELKGSLDEISIWSNPLSMADVQNIYTHQRTIRSGIYTSRVFNGLSAQTVGVNSLPNWTNLSWTTTLPFSKELPDAIGSTPQSESTANYVALASSTLMTGNIGLWHLNEAAGTSGTGSIIDSSGAGKNGTPTGGVTSGNPAVFNSGTSLDGSIGAIKLVSSTTSANNVSFSAWINPTIQTQMNIVGGTGVFEYLSLQSGNLCIRITWVGTLYCTSVGTIPLNQWTHVGLTFSYSSNQAVLRFYINGTPISPITISSITISTQSMSAIGVYYTGSTTTYYFKGSIDEVAVWNRILSDTEIQQLYRRGANRVKFQIRTCSLANCSDGIWMGESGNNTSYFSEKNNRVTQNAVMNSRALNTAPSLLFTNFNIPATAFSPIVYLIPSANQYFQYRAILESDDTSTSCNYGSGATWCTPGLLNVKVDPVHYPPYSTLTTKVGIPYSQLLRISEIIPTGKTCTAGISYNFSIDGTNWQYWNGGWGAADGTTLKSNFSNTPVPNLTPPVTGLMTNTVITSFLTNPNTNVYMKVFLNSNGLSSCDLSSVLLEGQ